MPGAGKSTVGRLLAARLGLPFLDSDAEVERQAGRSVPELFAAEGEAAFRRREWMVIATLLDEPCVLATGGGAMTQAETRALLLDRALTVWLDAPIAILAARIADGAVRPLLAGREPLSALARLLDERRDSYRQAAIHLRTDGLSALEAAEQLADMLSRSACR